MEEKIKKGKKFTTANGQTKFVVKKWCFFIFQDFFHSIGTNREKRCFDIYLKDQVEDLEGKKEFLKTEYQETIDYFKEYWGKDFNIIVLRQESI